MGEEKWKMNLKPYHTFQEAQKAAQNKQEDSADLFNSKSFIEHTNAYSAGLSYFETFCREAINLFKHISDEYCNGRAVRDEDLPEIAKRMCERASLIDKKHKTRWISHLTQIMNARRGSGGNPLDGYLKSFHTGYA